MTQPHLSEIEVCHIGSSGLAISSLLKDLGAPNSKGQLESRL